MESSEYKRVIDYVKQELEEGRLVLGSKLPTERKLSEELGLSRPSTREALKSMENIGLLTSRQGSGNYMACDMKKSLSEIMSMMLLMQQVDRHELNQMRCMMEVSSAKLAAEQMSAAELHSLEHLALNMIQTKNKDLHTLDEEFHDILLQGTKNKFMITIMQVFSDMCRESIEQTLAHASLEQLQQLCQQHLTIAQKMKAHDARGIEEAVIKHYELLEEQKS